MLRLNLSISETYIKLKIIISFGSVELDFAHQRCKLPHPVVHEALNYPDITFMTIAVAVLKFMRVDRTIDEHVM